MFEQGIFINGKTFGEIYLESKRNKKPTIVKNFMVCDGMKGASGYLEFNDNMLSDEAKRLDGKM